MIQNNTIEMTEGAEPPYYSGLFTFEENKVYPWIQSFGSPHHILKNNTINQSIWDCSPFLNGLGEIENCLIAKTYQPIPNVTVEHIEGIHQNFEFVKSNFITYSIKYDFERFFCEAAGTPDPNLELNVFFRAGNDFLNTGINQAPSEVETIDIIGTQSLTNYTGSIDYEPQSNFTQFQTYIRLLYPESPGEGYVSYNNVDISCSTTSLGEDFIINENCLEIGFQAQNLSSFSYSSYSWDFGDGNTSDQENPTHTYANPGSYTVILDIVNELGCCAQLCQEVVLDCCTQCPNYTANTIFLDGNNPDMDQLSEVFGPNVTSITGDFVVCGIFDFDIPVNVSFANFRFGPGAGIDITSTGTTNFSFSNFSGCTQMWRGIDINPNEIIGQQVRFSFVGNFSDAESALILNRNSDIWTWGVSFKENYISIFSELSYDTESMKAVIISNQFIGSGNMLEAYLGQSKWSESPYAGVYIQGADFINISNSLFDGLSNGIIAKNSILDVKNSVIKNFLNHNTNSYFGYGILGKRSKMTIKNNNIYNAAYGIANQYSNNNTIDISNNHIYHTTDQTNTSREYGIRINNCNNSYIKINHNKLHESNGYYSGITISNCHLLNNLDVNHNMISKIDLKVYGIILSSTDMASNSYGFIKNNYIYNNTELSGQTSACIQTNNCNSLSFELNILDVKNSNTNVNGSQFEVKGTTDSHFSDNDIKFTNGGIGFDATLSPNNLYCCNNVTKGQIAFMFKGNNAYTDPSKVVLSTNTFDNSVIGLELHQHSKIGKHTLVGNLWNNGGSFANIKVPGSSLSSLEIAQMAKSTAEANPFYTNPNSTYSTPMNISPDFSLLPEDVTWFHIDNGPTPNCGMSPTCNVLPYEEGNGGTGGDGNEIITPCDSLFRYIEHLLEPPVLEHHKNVSYWIEGRAIYKTNYYTGENLREDCDSLKQVIEEETLVDDYFRIEWDLKQAYAMDSQQQGTFDNSMGIVNENIQAINDIISNITTLEELETYDSQIEALQNEIYTHSVILESKRTTIEAHAKSEGVRLQSEIMSLPETFHFHQDIKKVWMVRAMILANGTSSISSSDWDELRTIAFYCPLDYGNAVYEARGLLDMVEENSFPTIDESCYGGSRNNSMSRSNDTDNIALISEKLKKDGIICYPNPSSDGKWKLSFSNELENINHLEVYNVLGEVVYKTTIIEGSTYYSLELPTSQSGFYILHIYNDTNLDYVQKLIIE